MWIHITRFVNDNLIEINGKDIDIAIKYSKDPRDLLQTQRSISREILGVWIEDWKPWRS